MRFSQLQLRMRMDNRQGRYLNNLRLCTHNNRSSSSRHSRFLHRTRYPHKVVYHKVRILTVQLNPQIPIS